MSKAKIAIRRPDNRAGDWPDWEQDRIRNFFDAKTKPIGGDLGTVRNFQLRLTKYRDGTGFKHKLVFYLEQMIGPSRITKSDVFFYLLDAAGKDIYSTSIGTTSFGRVCGGWKRIGWSRDGIDPDLFERVASFRLEGEADTKKC